LAPSFAANTVRALFHHELAEDPKDFLANHLIWASRNLARQKWFASVFLVSHGLAKVVLVVALWFNKLWAYPLMIVVLGGFILYQTGRFIETHSAMLALLTLFDVLIVWLTWREYREQRRIRAARDRSD
jgi:uncharacterized membrane protein